LLWGVSGSNDNDGTLHDFDTLGFLAFMILLSFFGRSGVSGFLTSMRFLFLFLGFWDLRVSDFNDLHCFLGPLICLIRMMFCVFEISGISGLLEFSFFCGFDFYLA
jgi:hypothetical protein